MDITPTREYLDDLQKRLERILRDDPDELEPEALQFGAADIFVLLKALNEAIARWRPVAGLTLSELRDAAAQQKSIGAAAWAPILATCKLSPRGLASALTDFGNRFYDLHRNLSQEGEEIFNAVLDAFGLDQGDLSEEAATDG